MLSEKFLDKVRYITLYAPVLKPIDKQDFIDYLNNQVTDTSLKSYINSADFVIDSEATARGWLALNHLLVRCLKGKLYFSVEDIALIDKFCKSCVGISQGTLFMKHLLAGE